LVLEISRTDKYAPKVTGVYNIDLEVFSGLIKNKKEREERKLAQQWYYDAETKYLGSKLFPDKVLFEGANKNLIVYAKRKLKNQIWNFDDKRNLWFNMFTNDALMVASKDHIDVGSNVITGSKHIKNKDKSFWSIIPCGQEHMMKHIRENIENKQ